MTQAYLKRPATNDSHTLYLFPKKHHIQRALQVSVVVPVRNEAVHLHETLDSLRLQVDIYGKALPIGTYEVLLLANNCTDDSAKIAQDYQEKYPNFLLQVVSIYLPPAQANIGTARRLLMDEACRRLRESDNPTGIIASTDGDTIVDSHWVYHIIEEIACGNDAVGGRILTKTNNSPVRLYHLRDVMYRSLLARAESIIDPDPYDPWPRHFQYFGASLAVTCRMYERAGRLPQVPYLEDNAFYTALNKVDAKIRKSTKVKVYTSTRMAGRVEVGFSEQLQKWNSLATQSSVQLVESVEALLIKFKNRYALRKCWQNYLQTGHCNIEIIAIAKALFVSPAWLKKQVEKSLFFGELWQQVEQEMNSGKWHPYWQPLPITNAINELRLFISCHSKL